MAGAKQLPPVHVAGGGSPMSLTAAISSGTRLDELRALREILVSHIAHENTLARDLAALSRQFREISKEIEELELADEPDELGKAADTDDEAFDPNAV